MSDRQLRVNLFFQSCVVNIITLKPPKFNFLIMLLKTDFEHCGHGDSATVPTVLRWKAVVEEVGRCSIVVMEASRVHSTAGGGDQMSTAEGGDHWNIAGGRDHGAGDSRSTAEGGVHSTTAAGGGDHRSTAGGGDHWATGARDHTICTLRLSKNILIVIIRKP